MTRVAFMIDGLNLFHALRDVRLAGDHLDIDLNAMAEMFLQRDEYIVSITLFTSIDPFSAANADKQEDFHRRSRSRGIDVVLGRFARRSRSCTVCGHALTTYEEKETDVNIAVELVASAIGNEVDKMMLVSGDSDLVPAIRKARSLNDSMQIGVIVPPGRTAPRLVAISDTHSRMKRRHVIQSRPGGRRED